MEALQTKQMDQLTKPLFQKKLVTPTEKMTDMTKSLNLLDDKIDIIVCNGHSNIGNIMSVTKVTLRSGPVI